MIIRHLTGFLCKHGRISKGVLERSVSTKAHKLNPYSPRQSVIDTLDPNKFAEKNQKRLHIANLQRFEPYITLRNQSTPVIVPRLAYDIFTKGKIFQHSPDTKAFLYYFTSPERPRIGGELRFRVASSDNSASFDSGSDLLKLDGQPWSRTLWDVSVRFIPLYEKLREEGLVPDDLAAALSTFPSEYHRYPERPVLYSLNDTFIVDFGIRHRYFSVITEQGMEILPFIGIFAERRRTLGTPYTGTALAQFERSTLPAHEGTRTVVLRFIKIITPVECMIPSYDGYIVQPKEGELHRKSHRHAATKKDDVVWSVDIDKKGAMMRGFQLLWDA